MKAKAKFKFNNGEIFECNLSGQGTSNINNKCNAIANRLEKPGCRELDSWKVYYRKTIPGRETVRVNCRWHVSGTVYRTDLGASIIKRFV